MSTSTNGIRVAGRRAWCRLASLLGLTLALALPAQAAGPASKAPQAKAQQAKKAHLAKKAQAAKKAKKAGKAKKGRKISGVRRDHQAQITEAQIAQPQITEVQAPPSPTQGGAAGLPAAPHGEVAPALAADVLVQPTTQTMQPASSTGLELAAAPVASAAPTTPVASAGQVLQGFKTNREAPAIWAFVDRHSGRAFLADEPVDERFRPILHSRSAESWRMPRQAAGRQAVVWMESAPEVRALQPLLDKAAAATGVDADLLKAIIMVESRFQPRVVSRDGATGLMQISPRTADTYATPAERSRAPARQRLKEPEHNIMTGARLLADLFKRLGHVDVALAAWNAGEGRVRRAGNKVPEHQGVRNHIRKVLEIYWGLLQRRPSAVSPGGAVSGDPVTNSPNS